MTISAKTFRRFSDFASVARWSKIPEINLYNGHILQCDSIVVKSKLNRCRCTYSFGSSYCDGNSTVALWVFRNENFKFFNVRRASLTSVYQFIPSRPRFDSELTTPRGNTMWVKTVELNDVRSIRCSKKVRTEFVTEKQVFLNYCCDSAEISNRAVKRIS